MYATERINARWITEWTVFFEVAKGDMERKGLVMMCCPCRKCGNTSMMKPEDVQMHVLASGFVEGYSRWTSHGEDAVDVGSGSEDDHGLQYDLANDSEEEIMVDEEANVEGEGAPCGRIAEMLDDPYLRDQLEDPDDEAECVKFKKLLEDANTPLYDGAGEENNVLEVTLELLRLKAASCWSDKGFTDLLRYLASVFPQPNKLPKSTYEAKKITCPLGLDCVKHHSCPNDCMVYIEEYENHESCHICGASRYKKKNARAGEDDGEEVMKGRPAKIVWYLSAGGRFERWMQNLKDARYLVHHDPAQAAIDPDGHYRVEQPGVLRHPADGTQWRNFDTAFPDFGEEPRNLRLGLSTDGINPFGNMNNKYSTWPVIMFVYNLPPWLIMKRKYIHLCMLIQGPKQPGADLNVYLQLVKNELKQLWNPGRVVWDANRREYFTLRAALLTCVHDYPANGNTSGQVTHGFRACTKCGENTTSQQLPASSKIVYMGHRKWLDRKDPWRDDKESFNGKTEHGTYPKEKSGRQILGIVNDLEVVPGKIAAKKRKEPEGVVWKRRSVFWDLEYWPLLECRHSIDVMHVEKNVCDSVLGLLMNIAEKTKDGPKARKDLELMSIRKELWGKEEVSAADKNGFVTVTTRCRLACYNMYKDELRRMCQCLHGIKVPSNYSSTIKHLVDMKSHKLSGMKSHDCHVILTQLLPVAIRGIMEPHVRETIMKLSDFFDSISQKSITVRRCQILQDSLIQILCELEMFFPPSFFDIMVHLMIHICDEILSLGPSFLHNMYGPERYNGVLKRYVRNRSRPEGSIVEGFRAEECIEFCTDWLADQKSIGVPESRHNGKLDGVGGLGHTFLNV